ncbi:MAG: cell division protein FtsL [Lachnospiraceae bacterium]|nr:cell division protein FtsL [Lachnospiraceae bacterium]
MKDRELNRKINNVIYVTEGNAVRKVTAVPKKEEAPERKRRELTERERRELHRQNRNYRKTYRENENAFTMSVPYVIFLTVAVVAVVVMCIHYLQLNSKVSDIKGNISLLESNIDTLAAQNDAIEYDIEGFINLDYILQVATEELGMVYATKDQIQYYDSTTSEYMKQFGDIPESN